MLKTLAVSGTLSLVLATGLYYQHKALTAQETALKTTQTTVETLQTQNAEYVKFQEKLNDRLTKLESRKQDFEHNLGKAIAANPADAARVTPAAVVSELCAYAKCRDQPKINAASGR